MNAPAPAPSPVVPATTGSRGSRVLGVAVLAGLAALLALAFGATDPDVRLHPTTGEEIGQFDAVRLIYVHVPLAVTMYLAFGLAAVASAGYLIKRTPWWDVTAHAAAEVGTWCWSPARSGFGRCGTPGGSGATCVS